MLYLDSEALSAVAHGPAARRLRTLALMSMMRDREEQVATIAAVLAEVVRGRRRDANIFQILKANRIIVEPVDRRIGVRAGQLLGATRRGSDHAVDALLVAAADIHGRSLVATVDHKDLEPLAAQTSDVEVISIQPRRR